MRAAELDATDDPTINRVGAALIANTFKMKGLAISVGQSDPWQWGTAARFAVGTAGWLVQRKEAPLILNINIPPVPYEEIVGIWADLDEFGCIRVATAEARGDAPSGLNSPCPGTPIHQWQWSVLIGFGPTPG